MVLQGGLSSISMPPVPGIPDLDTAHQMCLTRAEQIGRITSLDLLTTLFLMQPRRWVAILTTRVHRWLMVSLVFPRALKSSSAKLFPAGWSPVCTGAYGYASQGAKLGTPFC